MTTAIKRRRGTTAQHATFTGLEGEITVDTTKDTVVVHDGLVAGGHPLAKEKDPTFTGTVTLTGGTANGVAYLNGSKVLTTGSALTFDGTNLSNSSGAIGASNGFRLPVDKEINFANGADSNNRILVNSTSGSMEYRGFNGHTFYNTGSGELMRLTSTGLGIGTSSPSYKLDVTGSFRVWGGALASSVTPTNYIASENSSDAVALEVRQGRYNKDALVVSSNQALSANLLRLHENGTDRMVVTGSGNLGLGVTPSAWYSLFKTIDIGQGTSLTGQTNTPSTILATNTFWNSGATPIYKSTAAASYYASYGGQHLWYTAPSGTAGNAISFTQAMTLDASGNLGIGGNSAPSYALHVGNGTADKRSVFNPNSAYAIGVSNASAFAGWIGGSGVADTMVFSSSGGSERMRIDSSGNLLVGTTASNGKARIVQSANDVTLRVENSLTTGTTTDIFQVISAQAAGTGYYLARLYASGPTPQFAVRGDGTVYAQNTTIQSLSDARTKENVRASDEGLEVIGALRPVRFDFKEGFGNNRKNQLGFIAQEVEQVFPDAVDIAGESDEEGNPYKSVGPGALIPVLVKAIQELTARVAQLEGN